MAEFLVPMPVSPSGVSGISACHFRNCQSFDELWIFRVGPATFKYRTDRKIRNPRTPSTLQACSFFSNPFLEFCILTPTFSSTILLHKFMQVFDTLKIPVHCFGTRDNLKKVICLILSYTRFLLLCHFIWIWTYKTHELTDHQLIVHSFLPAITFMWSDWQIPGLPQFFQQQVFPSLPASSVAPINSSCMLWSTSLGSKSGWCSTFWMRSLT